MKKLLMILALLSVPAGSLFAGSANGCCSTCSVKAKCEKSCCPKKSTCGCPRPEVDEVILVEDLDVDADESGY